MFSISEKQLLVCWFLSLWKLKSVSVIELHEERQMKLTAAPVFCRSDGGWAHVMGPMRVSDSGIDFREFLWCLVLVAMSFQDVMAQFVFV